MNQEVVLLSDLWGSKKSEWVNHYRDHLTGVAAFKFYDSCALGGINMVPDEKDHIHRQFVDFGIQNAARQLLHLEKQAKTYIGCSVGGVIVWRAGLLGLPIQQLILISSTRLRKEKDKPLCPITIYFGELDSYQPDLHWYQKMGLQNEIIPKGSHEIYKIPSLLPQFL
ncbi:MAG: hypothetical protein AAGD05_07430, partial [Bacteroidota bacterium]